MTLSKIITSININLKIKIPFCKLAISHFSFLFTHSLAAEHFLAVKHCELNTLHDFYGFHASISLHGAHTYHNLIKWGGNRQNWQIDQNDNRKIFAASTSSSLQSNITFPDCSIQKALLHSERLGLGFMQCSDNKKKVSLYEKLLRENVNIAFYIFACQSFKFGMLVVEVF